VNAPIDISLSLAQWQFLGTLLPTPPTLASPWGKPAPGQGPLAAAARRDLVVKGLLTEAGAPTPQFMPLLTELAAARKQTYVAAGGDSLLFDVAVYHAANGPVALSLRDGHVRLVSPAPLERMVSLLGEQLGQTAFRFAPLDLHLTRAEALALAAMVDLRRRNLLGQMLDREARAVPLIPFTAVADWLAARQPAQWLVAQLRRFLRNDGELAAGILQTALTGLVAKGWLQEQAGAYRPTAPLDHLANRLLVLDGRISAHRLQLSRTGDPILARFEILRGGHSDLLLWELKGHEALHLLALSPKAAVELLAAFLLDPALDESLDRYALNTCPHCAASVPEKSKFCPACGTRLDALPTAAKGNPCPKCQVEVEPGARFCHVCGTAMSAPAPIAPRAPAATAPAPVFCSQCGARGAAGEKFCAACGAAL